jgi:hypothetical protein
MPCIALIFEALDREGKVAEITLETTEKAIKFCSVLESHIRKVFSDTIHSPYYAATCLSEKIISGCLVEGMSRRDVLRKGWKGLRKAYQVNQGLMVLSELDWLHVHHEPKKGGGIDHIMLNPKLKSFFTNH